MTPTEPPGRPADLPLGGLIAVRELAERAAAAPHLYYLYRTVVDIFLRTFDAQRAVLLLVDAAGVPRIGASAGFDAESRLRHARWIPWSTSASDPATPLILDRETAAGQAAPPALLPDDMQQVLFLPLRVGARLVGAVALHHCSQRPFSPAELALGETLGVQSAVALDAKRVEAASHSRARMLAHFVEDAPIGLKVMDEHGRILWANASELALFGVAPREYVGCEVGEFLADDEQRRELLAGLADSHAVDNLEVRLLHKDGSIRHALLSARTVWEEGGPARVYCFLRDITDRKRGELHQQFLLQSSRLLASSLQYERTLELLTGLAVPDLADWSLLDMADATGAVQAVAVAHRDPDQVPLLRLIRERYPLGRSGSRLPAAEVLRRGEPILVPVISSHALNEYAHDAEHARLIHELNPRSMLCVPLILHGRVIGTLTWVRTIGSPSYDERDLAVAEALASRAVFAVEHARLFTEAQEANRLKDVFLANVSHELRTPLNAIAGWASILERQIPDDAPTRQAVDTILRNAHMQTRLVDDLLDVSGAISGKLRLNTTELAIEAPVMAAIETVRPAADAKRLRIELEIERPAEPVTGDPDRLQQVFWNLLSNAVKFSAGGSCIHIRIARAGTGIEVSVRDHGPGISRDFLPYLFDPFQQAQAVHGHRGLGLGLAIVRHIVEMHGGQVWAQSEGEGRGATFTVRLPIRAVRLAREESPAASTSRRLVGLQVLVVDDEADSRALVGTVLNAAGASVRLADSVKAAEEAVRELPPDLLVSDIGLLGEDGVALLRRLRLRHPALPAVAVSAYATEQDRLRALDAGFQRYLVKPIDPERLAALVAELAMESGSSL